VRFFVLACSLSNGDISALGNVVVKFGIALADVTWKSLRATSTIVGENATRTQSVRTDILYNGIVYGSQEQSLSIAWQPLLLSLNYSPYLLSWWGKGGKGREIGLDVGGSKCPEVKVW
jgi:hypothetical protein